MNGSLDTRPNRRDQSHTRIPITRPVVLVHDGARIECSTLDVSVGGMRIRCELPLREGTPVRIHLTLAAPYHELDLAATVRWCRSGELGVHFGTPRARDTWALNALTRLAR